MFERFRRRPTQPLSEHDLLMDRLRYIPEEEQNRELRRHNLGATIIRSLDGGVLFVPNFDREKFAEAVRTVGPLLRDYEADS